MATTSIPLHHPWPSAAIRKIEVGHRIKNSGPARYPQHRFANPAASICTTGITIPAAQKERTILDRSMYTALSAIRRGTRPSTAATRYVLH